MSVPDPGWLMVVDLQPAFGHAASPWFTPALDAVADRIAALVPLFGERVIFTRFVPPPEPLGSWHAYYEKWAFARDAASDWLWRLDPRFGERPSITSHRFSKWLPELRDRMGGGHTLVLCGVSTDCCVLATALAATDDGMHVRVLEDGCAAKSPEIHARALAIMADRAPQISIATLAKEHARQSAYAQEKPA